MFSEAEDRQEVFIQLFRKIGSFRGELPLLPAASADRQSGIITFANRSAHGTDD